MEKACIYFNKLDDLNIETLKELSKETIAYLYEHHECACKS